MPTILKPEDDDFWVDPEFQDKDKVAGVDPVLSGKHAGQQREERESGLRGATQRLVVWLVPCGAWPAR